MGNVLGTMLPTSFLAYCCALAAVVFLAVLSVRLVVIDIRTHRLPNRLVGPGYVVGILLLGAAALLAGEPVLMLRMVIGALAAGGFYWVLWAVYPAGMGFGDVKLAGLLGLYLGFSGWTFVILGIAAGFVVGGVWGIVVMLSRRGNAKSRIPFGPSMLTGAWLVMFLPL